MSDESARSLIWSYRAAELTFPQLLVAFEALPMTLPRRMVDRPKTLGEMYERSEGNDLTDVPAALRSGLRSGDITDAEHAHLMAIYNRKIGYRGA